MRERFAGFMDCALRRDGAGFAELFTEDAILEFPFAGLRYVGRDAIRTRAVEAWGHSPFSPLAFDDVAYTDAPPDTLVVEYGVRGTVRGEPLTVRAILHLRGKGGRIALFREYLDPLALAAVARSIAPPRDVLRRYHAAMQAKSADALADLYAEDGIHEFSFYVPNRPERLVGREQVRASYREGWRDHPLDIAAIEDVFVHQTDDLEVVIGQWRAAATLRATGAQVGLTGLLALRVRGGQIVHTRDFMDGLGIARALGRPPFGG